jgi:hypothetical protein
VTLLLDGDWEIMGCALLNTAGNNPLGDFCSLSDSVQFCTVAWPLRRLS